MKEKLPSYGGQALIEGVMMRGSTVAAAAMRTPDGEIVTRVEELPAIYKSQIKKIPFLRGIVLLWDSLGLGMNFLIQSANNQSGEDEQLSKKEVTFSIITSLLFAGLVFFMAPAGVGHLAERWFQLNAWYGNLIEGLVRMVIVVAYIWGIGRMSDIRRVFQYHGAEHKTINAFEAELELTPANVMRCSLEHPRCGTGFLLTLVIFSVILFSLIGPLPVIPRLLSRILFLPVLAGIAYEYIRWTANHIENPLVRMLVKPNLWLQKLTTVEPTEPMVEVAICAFNTMYAHERVNVQVQSGQAVNLTGSASGSSD